MRLRWLGINLLGARNSALDNLVAEVPPPLIAELLGYSYKSPNATPTWPPNLGLDTSHNDLPP
jgi:hypothetical protein